MIRHDFLDELRNKIRAKKDSVAAKREQWIRSNPYYYKQLINTLHYIIPEGSSILNVGCSTGFLLNELKPSRGVGVDGSAEQINIAKQQWPNLKFFDQEPESCDVEGTFDFILIYGVEDIVDVKSVLDAVKKNCHRDTRLIVCYYNFLWEPLVTLAEKCRIRLPQAVHNWFSGSDINNIMEHSGFDPIHIKKLVLWPFNIPGLSYLLNRFAGRLPVFHHLTMMRVAVARPVPEPMDKPSVSIVIPCRNEEGNIESAVERIPQLGSHTEIIFCDDKSTDGTADKVREMQEKYPDKDIKLVDGPGICKADNVWTGFDAATCDILMILDADLTVIPEELPYFYEAIASGRGEFINGSRLVYPMHEEAMRICNIIGNKFFSLLFSYILDTPIKDTLCGTKVVTRENFRKIKAIRGCWGVKDRWGDYELIFGAAKNHLKIVDLPVHYMERTYGETKMTNRFKNGWIMLRFSLASMFGIKFH